VATQLAKNGVSAMLIAHILNHHKRNVNAIHIRYTFDDVAKALQARADRFYALRSEEPKDENARTLTADEALMHQLMRCPL
jgi:hypothetical protein